MRLEQLIKKRASQANVIEGEFATKD